MNKKRAALIISGIMTLIVALGVSAVFAQVERQEDIQAKTEQVAQVASELTAQPAAQDDSDQDESTDDDSDGEDQIWPQGPFARRGGSFGQFGHPGRGFGHLPGGNMPMAELIAENLGVTVEQLEQAHDQVLEGLTDEDDGFFHGPRGLAISNEFELQLADALSDISGNEITVEMIKTAREAAREEMLEQLPEALGLSEEQLALIEARQLLREAIDHEALLTEAAEAVGLDPELLLDTLGTRGALYSVLEEAGVTMEEFMLARQEAFENAVQNAVPEFLTQDQADLILEGEFGGPGFGGPRGLCNPEGAGPGMGNRGGFHGRGGYGGQGRFAPSSGNAGTSTNSL